MYVFMYVRTPVHALYVIFEIKYANKLEAKKILKKKNCENNSVLKFL